MHFDRSALGCHSDFPSTSVNKREELIHKHQKADFPNSICIVQCGTYSQDGGLVCPSDCSAGCSSCGARRYEGYALGAWYSPCVRTVPADSPLARGSSPEHVNSISKSGLHNFILSNQLLSY